MAKKSSDQDIELKSINSKKSDYENDNRSEYDINEDENTKQLYHLIDKSDNENETTPFIVNNNSNNSEEATSNLNPEVKSTKKQEDGDEGEHEALLGHNETNLDSVHAVEGATPENPNTLEQVENGESEPKNVESLVSRLIEIVKSNMVLFLSITALFVATIVAVLILPNAIFSIEYDKMALSRNKWTGTVDDTFTYLPGLHLMLPWSEWIFFEKTAKNFQIYNMPIFTSDALSVNCSFGIFYMFEPENLGKFYRKFGIENPGKLINSVLRSELMNEGLKFSIEDYRTKRVTIVKALREKLKERLKKDYFINVINIFMEKLTFTQEINRLNLVVVLNNVYNEKALNEQQSEYVNLNTKVMVNKIQNEASIVLETAEQNANYTIVEVAKKEADYLQEIAYLTKLTKSLKELNFIKDKVNTKEESQRALSYCYLSSLINTNSTVKYHSPRDDGISINSPKFGYLTGASGIITI